MNNFIEEVCNISISNIENIRIDKLKYDTYNPFSKYYSYDVIEKAVNKYKENKVSLSYLQSWFNLYNYILNGGFKDNVNESENEIIDFVRSEVTWMLEGLSFFSDDEELNDYLESLKVLDNILSSTNDWVVYYATMEDDDVEEQNILLVNENKQLFFEVVTDFYEDGDETERLICLKNKEYKNKVNLLKALNYKQLDY